MRILPSLALALALATPAVAADTSGSTQEISAKRGQSLYDVNGRKVGEVIRVLADGSVKVIYDQRAVTVSGTTLSTADGKLKTSLTWTDLRKL